MLLGISQLYSNPVDVSTARKAGVNFAQTRFAAFSKSDEVQLVKTTDAYYVFNVGTQGFVIISADDSFRPVVGYSDEGVFDAENPSPEMMYYLDDLSQGRSAALRASIQADEKVMREWAGLLDGESSAPTKGKAAFYLVQTKWNQNFPYNPHK